MKNNSMLLPLLKRGGVFCALKGSTPSAVLKDLISKLDLPRGLEREVLQKAVLEREDMQSTAWGRGVALPHPRNPVISAEGEQFIAIGITENPVSWQALDGIPVRIVILIVSASAKSHLHTLSKISFLSCQNDFLSLLESCPEVKKIENYINNAEESWGS